MNHLNTLTSFFSLILLSLALQTSAQQSYTYHFASAPFNSEQPGGPTLQPIGTVHTPVTVTIPATTCPSSPTVTLTHFDENSGFKARAFFTNTYSIEIIFKFNQFDNYNRIIDFSNGMSDNGIYTHYDCLNFYPTGSIGTCPGAFDTVNYKQLVITRNGTTGVMRVYLNDSLFTTYVDDANYYVIGGAPNDSVRFFHDDNDVPNEASSGDVAYVRMTDYELSAQDVDAGFAQFCSTLASVDGTANANGANIYPNPANEQLNVAVPNSWISSNTRIRLLNALGQVVLDEPIGNETASIATNRLPSGVYGYQIQNDNTLLTSGKVIVQRQR